MRAGSVCLGIVQRGRCTLFRDGGVDRTGGATPRFPPGPRFEPRSFARGGARARHCLRRGRACAEPVPSLPAGRVDVGACNERAFFLLRRRRGLQRPVRHHAAAVQARTADHGRRAASRRPKSTSFVSKATSHGGCGAVRGAQFASLRLSDLIAPLVRASPLVGDARCARPSFRVRLGAAAARSVRRER